MNTTSASSRWKIDVNLKLKNYMGHIHLSKKSSNCAIRAARMLAQREMAVSINAQKGSAIACKPCMTLSTGHAWVEGKSTKRPRSE